MSTTTTDLDTLRLALDGLTDALCRPAVVLDREDDLTIELSYDAGKRFEVFLVREQHYVDVFRIVDDGEKKPWREVCLDGVLFRWPVKVIAREGHLVAEPIAIPFPTMSRASQS